MGSDHSHLGLAVGIAVDVALLPSVLGGSLPWWVLLAAPAATEFGSLLPDLCQRQSMISKRLPGFGGVFRAVFHPKHRALNTINWAVTFSLFFGLVTAALTCWLGSRLNLVEDPWKLARTIVAVVAGCVFLGYMSHIVTDWIFNGGAAFHPKTNGITERVAAPAMCAAVILAPVWVMTYGWHLPNWRGDETAKTTPQKHQPTGKAKTEHPAGRNSSTHGSSGAGR